MGSSLSLVSTDKFLIIHVHLCLSLCQGLAQLEILCKQLYETTDTTVRHQAEKALVEFTNSPDCLSKCQLLLERGSVSPTCPVHASIFFSCDVLLTLVLMLHYCLLCPAQLTCRPVQHIWTISVVYRSQHMHSISTTHPSSPAKTFT